MTEPDKPRKTSKSEANQKRWRFAGALAKSAVSIALLWALFSIYDIGAALERIASIDPVWTAAAFAAFFLSIVAAAARWGVVLRALGVKVPLPTLTSLIIMSVFFNQTLPSNLGGDAMRIWRLFRRGAGLQRAVGSILLDHVMSMVGLALLVLVALPWAAILILDSTIVFVLVGVVVAILSGLGVLLVLDRAFIAVLRFLPARLLDAVLQLSRDARTVLLARRVVGPLLIAAVATHLFGVMLMTALAYGLGIAVDLGAFMVLVPPAILASLVPLSFAGWGVREGAMIALLGSIGIVPEEALALSVAFGVLLLIGSLPGGLIWLVTGNRADPPASEDQEPNGTGA